MTLISVTSRRTWKRQTWRNQTTDEKWKGLFCRTCAKCPSHQPRRWNLHLRGRCIQTHHPDCRPTAWSAEQKWKQQKLLVSQKSKIFEHKARTWQKISVQKGTNFYLCWSFQKVFNGKLWQFRFDPSEKSLELRIGNHLSEKLLSFVEAFHVAAVGITEKTNLQK